MADEQLPDLMTVGEVAEVLRLSDETIHRRCRDRQMEFIEVLGVKRFRRAYIEGLISAGTQSERAS
jgi:excisionase family DNA binding protein